MKKETTFIARLILLSKELFSDPQPHPSPLFFLSNIMEILVPEVDSYKRLFLWSGICNMCSLRELIETTLMKWENTTTFYKTISNMNLDFSYCLQTRHKFAFFFHLDWYIGSKSDNICQLNEWKFIFQRFQNKPLLKNKLGTKPTLRWGWWCQYRTCCWCWTAFCYTRSRWGSCWRHHAGWWKLHTKLLC